MAALDRDTAPATFDFHALRNSGIDLPRPEDEAPGRGSILIALSMLTAGLFTLVLWAEQRPNFVRCIELMDAATRAACYEQLRTLDTQAPAKGARAPAISTVEP